MAAAGRRFSELGYAATTIRDIAGEAGVSAETVYKAFGSKLELLRRWVDDRVAGPDEPVPVIEQGWVGNLEGATDPRQQMAIAAGALRVIHDRAAEAMTVLASAAHADAGAAELWDTVRAQRLSDVRAVVRLIADGGGIDPALDHDDVVDIAYALSEPQLYRTLVVDRGWSPDRYETWLTEIIWNQLAPGQRGPNREVEE